MLVALWKGCGLAKVGSTILTWSHILKKHKLLFSILGHVLFEPSLSHERIWLLKVELLAERSFPHVVTRFDLCGARALPIVSYIVVLESAFNILL